jgi:glycosyl transferase family 9 (putative heptosyltransferase)
VAGALLTTTGSGAAAGRFGRRGTGVRAVRTFAGAGEAWDSRTAAAVSGASTLVSLATLDALAKALDCEPGDAIGRSGARSGRQMNLVPELGNWNQTAAALAQMDLVISVDSSLAHLAGGMGLPVWIPLQAAVEWRWGLESPTTPWYPSARLFRQSHQG